MINIRTNVVTTLSAAGFSVTLRGAEDPGPIAFENGTILGFIFAYEAVSSLLTQWDSDVRSVIEVHRLALRRGGQKAWNTYVILLAENEPVDFESVQLTAIEEDLTGTRKIARGGIGSTSDVKNALLPILPLQNAPRLEAVDSVAEVERRTTALDPRVRAAFLSSASQAVLLSVIEETR